MPHNTAHYNLFSLSLAATKVHDSAQTSKVIVEAEWLKQGGGLESNVICAFVIVGMYQ